MPTLIETPVAEKAWQWGKGLTEASYEAFSSASNVQKMKTAIAQILCGKTADGVYSEAAYQKLLASRNDHPVCEIFKIFQLPLKDREKAFMLAAERGNPEIIALLLRWKNAQPEYWKLLYLAGKYDLAAKYNPQPSQSFYSQ